MASIGSVLNPRIGELEKLAEFTQNELRGMTIEIDKEFCKNEVMQFKSEGSSGGRKWPPLSSEYAARKAAMRRRRVMVDDRPVTGRKVMQLTGLGRKSLTQKSHPDHIATYFGSATQALITVGTQVTHLAYHIAFSTNPLYNKRMPHRDTLQMTAAQEERYIDIVARRMKAKVVQVYHAVGRIRRRQAL